MGKSHQLWTGQVFKGRVDCDKWSREGWGPVVLTIEVTGVRDRESFVCLTHIDEPTSNVRSADIWMEADGTFNAKTGEVSIAESAVHAHSNVPPGTEVVPFTWYGLVEGIRFKGGFKVLGNAAEYGRTMLNMLCISGGAKTHILSGNVAMEEVRNRIGGLHKALEAESWERRKSAKSVSRRVAMGLASRRADADLNMNRWDDIEGARAQMVSAQKAAATNISQARQAAVRASMDLTANRLRN